MREGFSRRVVVVTGAAGGIGRSLCRRLADAGAEVVALDRDHEALGELTSELPVDGRAVDLTRAGDVVACVADLERVDVLVNNAGVTALGTFGDLPPAALERVVAVNLIGSANITHTVLDRLVAARGRIAVMSSVAGFAPLIHRTAYAASKHALHGLFTSLRAELADSGVTITMVCPTFADTGIENRAVARAAGPSGRWSTTGRHLSADEVAVATLDGLGRRRRMVLPGVTAKLAYALSRVSPVGLERLMRRRVSAG